MKITLTAGGRSRLIDGLALLLAQTKSARGAEAKAYLSTAKTDKQIELIAEAARTVPAFNEIDDPETEIRIWEIPMELDVVYRDGLLAYGTTVAKVRYEAEKKLHLDLPTAKKRVVEIQALLRELGDGRDVIVEMEQREREKERRREAKANKPDPAQLGIGDGEGVDGLGARPPRAEDVDPIHVDDRIAASPAPRPPGAARRQFHRRRPPPAPPS